MFNFNNHSMKNVKPTIGTSFSISDSDLTDDTVYTFTSQDSGAPPGPTSCIIVSFAGDSGSDVTLTQGSTTFNGTVFDDYAPNDVRTPSGIAMQRNTTQTASIVITYSGNLTQCAIMGIRVDGLQDVRSFFGSELDNTAVDADDNTFTTFFDGQEVFDASAVNYIVGNASSTNGTWGTGGGIGGTTQATVDRTWEIFDTTTYESDIEVGTGVVTWWGLPEDTPLQAIHAHSDNSPQRKTCTLVTLK